ncbi:heavy-metal-associated domain-containing protein [Parvibium lacunae]|uniref:Copper chaperone n=1 Tax=Parvibium lacunae TaxID=1888893 RepID=A0A368L0W0_9BURK|nr:heavy-metal-associated domain-containing protein [Parvibium lacunae]RCS57075.1 copper chaperone [Parvibium lacunae]
MTKTKLLIEGMTCGGCVTAVTRVLSALPGVAAVQVMLDTHSADVEYDPEQVTVADFQRVVEDAGFEVV